MDYTKIRKGQDSKETLRYRGRITWKSLPSNLKSIIRCIQK